MSLTAVAVLWLTPGGLAAFRVIVHRGVRSQPQQFAPFAVAAAAAASRGEPVNAAVERLKAREAGGYRPHVPRMKRLVARPERGIASAASGASFRAGLGFAGLDSLMSGGYVPADVTVGAGGGWVVEAVNTEMSIWTRTGSFVLRSPLSAILGAPNAELSDPQIVYDQLSGRWFLSALRIDTGATYFAVSTSSDPAGYWNGWYLTYASEHCADQPRLGVSSTVVALSVSLFDTQGCRSGSQTVLGGALIVLNKADMLADANQPGYQTFEPDPNYDNYQPAIEAQPTSEELFASAQTPSSNVIHVVHLTGTPPAASFSSTDTYLVSQLDTPA